MRVWNLVWLRGISMHTQCNVAFCSRPAPT